MTSYVGRFQNVTECMLQRGNIAQILILSKPIVQNSEATKSEVLVEPFVEQSSST